MKASILAERLKEEIRDRKVLAATFYSFNFDVEFFENYLLPLFLPDIPFGDNKIQNTILWIKYQKELPPVTVYCDFHAKGITGASLKYEVRTVDIPKDKVKACFHPKHSFILLDDWTIICLVGSNNLTESGWCSNLEGLNLISLKSGRYFPRSFKDEFKFFTREIQRTYYQKEGKTKAEELIDKCFRSIGYKGRTQSLLFDSKVESFDDFLLYVRDEMNGGKDFKEIEVVSPYYSPGTTLFKNFQEITGCDDISFSAPFSSLESIALDKAQFNAVKELGMQWGRIAELRKFKGYRFNHSKMYHLRGEEHVFTIVGSVNFTQMAFKGVSDGGNHESAVLYRESIDSWENWLETDDFDDCTFEGSEPEENRRDERYDAYDLKFSIDWAARTLSFKNRKPTKQKGYIQFDNSPSIYINVRSKSVTLNDDLYRSLSDNPIIKVKPTDIPTHFYYYPEHINIEAKPLPSNINLTDSELLELWIALEDGKDKEETLRILDKLASRISDEEENEASETYSDTKSTLNLMASHLSGLIRLKKKLFTQGQTVKEKKARLRLFEYYLLTDNVDTLIGYHKLIKKMLDKSEIQQGFYWFLLKILHLYFYNNAKKKDFNNHSQYKNNIRIADAFKKEIRSLGKIITDGDTSVNQLKWVENILNDDLK